MSQYGGCDFVIVKFPCCVWHFVKVIEVFIIGGGIIVIGDGGIVDGSRGCGLIEVFGNERMRISCRLLVDFFLGGGVCKNYNIRIKK